MSHPLKPSRENIRDFVLISLVSGAALAFHWGGLNLENMVSSVLIASFVVLTREAAMRMIVHWMDGYIDTRISIEGSAVTLAGAMIAVITGLGFILLFPLKTDLDMKKYEQWGKGIDSMWAKKKFWVHGVGVLSLVVAGYLSLGADLHGLSRVYGLFAVFQLMPFNYPDIPTGTLDGAHILRWSGWTWLIEMGLSLILVALTL